MGPPKFWWHGPPGCWGLGGNFGGGGRSSSDFGGDKGARRMQGMWDVMEWGCERSLLMNCIIRGPCACSACSSCHARVMKVYQLLDFPSQDSLPAVRRSDHPEGCDLVGRGSHKLPRCEE